MIENVIYFYMLPIEEQTALKLSGAYNVWISMLSNGKKNEIVRNYITTNGIDETLRVITEKSIEG